MRGCVANSNERRLSARVELERARLERENTRLKDELEAARRAGARHEAIFEGRAETATASSLRAPSRGRTARALQLLVDADVDATNWRAQHALRPAVIRPKVCGGGNRSRRGADAQHILATILRTAQQRGLDATDVLTTLLRAPAPIVSPHFYPKVSVN